MQVPDVLLNVKAIVVEPVLLLQLRLSTIMSRDGWLNVLQDVLNMMIVGVVELQEICLEL